MSNSKFITAAQAAEMCGVTTMTIRNLCKAGVLSYQMRSHLFYPNAEEVKKYAKSISEINEAHTSIDHYKVRVINEERELIEQLLEMKEKYRERMINLDMFPRRIEAIKETLCAVIEGLSQYTQYDDCCITEREIKACWMALQGKTFEEIGKNFRLTQERASQIWHKALRKFLCVKGAFYHINQENESLREKINAQAEEIAHLKALLAGEEIELSDEVLRVSKLLATSVLDCDLTARAKNCLKYAEVCTFRDLCKYRRADLLKFRNFGMKSLRELDELLNRNGLSFGMNVDMYPEYVTPKEVADTKTSA